MSGKQITARTNSAWPRPTTAASPLAPRPFGGPPSHGGQALDKHTQAEMSAKFGHDFSQVRIHTDALAAQSAQSVGANAYALGSDIVFGGGQYTPGSPDTERLLAHELTHVVQQDRWGLGDWGRTSHKGDASEREADSLASQVMAGRSVSAQAAPVAAVAREIDYDLALPDPTPDLHPGQYAGSEPPASGDWDGSYGFVKTSKYGGVEFGGSGRHMQDNSTGVPVSYDKSSGEGKYGAWDGDTGEMDGFHMAGAGEKVTINKGGRVSADVSALDANADANFGEDGFNFGAGANIVDGSATLQNDHESLRLGGSVGMGAAARGYWGQDKDGFRNYGFGFDLGPVSMDLKSKDPLRTGAELFGLNDEFPSKGNLTEDMANQFGLTTKNANLDTTWDALTGGTAPAPAQTALGDIIAGLPGAPAGDDNRLGTVPGARWTQGGGNGSVQTAIPDIMAGLPGGTPAAALPALSGSSWGDDYLGGTPGAGWVQAAPPPPSPFGLGEGLDNPWVN